MPNIAYVRPEVVEAITKWRKIRDCITGDTAVKVAGSEGDLYLPRPNKSDTSIENLERYRQYVERAVFYPVTNHTWTGMVGQAFQSDPTIELPNELDFLADNADGAGVSLAQSAKTSLGSVLAYGRCGLLADYPSVDSPSSQAEIDEGYIRPVVLFYQPWDIINWRTTTVGARKLLSMVVLAETVAKSDDGFEVETEDRWRVLALQDGQYSVTVFRQAEGANASSQYEIVSGPTFPKDSAGRPIREIPFRFIGSENNDENVDQAPLYDIASLNIAHYRNSADYEESVFICGQPTPWASGITKDWVKDVFKGQIRIGSRAFLPLPVGGQCGLLQVSPNGLVKEAMEQKERQMVALGARLVEQRSVQRTAAEARMDLGTELSVLGACSKNVASAYRDVIGFAGQFVGATGDIVFEIDPDSELRKMTPDELRALVTTWQAGAIATSEMRSSVRRSGLGTLEDEAYKDEIESSPPPMTATAQSQPSQEPQGGDGDEQA